MPKLFPVVRVSRPAALTASAALAAALAALAAGAIAVAWSSGSSRREPR
jgi:hypothetical protein